MEEEAELVAELFAVESNDLYSSSILSNNIPFDRASIFLLRISTCTVFANQQYSVGYEEKIWKWHTMRTIMMAMTMTLGVGNNPPLESKPLLDGFLLSTSTKSRMGAFEKKMISMIGQKTYKK